MTFQKLGEKLAFPAFRGYRGLVVALALDSLGTGLFLPFALVYFLHTTSIPLAVIGAGLTAARLLALPTSLVVGPLIDRFDARRVLVAGNFISAVAFVGYLFVETTWQLIATSLLVSAGQAIFWTAIRALVGETVEPEKRPSWFALQSMTRNAGFGLGGLVGAVLIGGGEAWLYLALAAANAVSFVAAGLLLLWWKPPVTSESQARSEASGERRGGYRQLVRDRALLVVTSVNLAFVMCANVLNVLLVVYVTTVLRQPAWLGGALFTVNTILVSTTQTVTTNTVRRFSKVGVLRGATLCWAASFVLLWAMSAVPAWLVVPGLFVAIVVFTVAEMLQDPIINTLVVGIAPPNLSGRYVAAFQLSWSVGSAIAPALLTWLLETGVSLAWIVMLLICAAAIAGIGRIAYVPVAKAAVAS